MRPTKRWRRVFVGPDGLRAGWSALLYLLIAVGLTTTLKLSIPSYASHVTQSGTGELSRAEMAIGQIIAFLGALVATWLMSRIEHRSILDYGFLDTRWLFRFLGGALCGFGALSVLVLALLKVHAIALDGMGLHGFSLNLRYALAWIFSFLLIGFTEECITWPCFSPWRYLLWPGAGKAVSGRVTRREPLHSCPSPCPETV